MLADRAIKVTLQSGCLRAIVGAPSPVVKQDDAGAGHWVWVMGKCPPPRDTHHPKPITWSYTAGPRTIASATLRVRRRPAVGWAVNWPFSTTTWPCWIVMVGQPAIDQPSHGL